MEADRFRELRDEVLRGDERLLKANHGLLGHEVERAVIHIKVRGDQEEEPAPIILPRLMREDPVGPE